MSILVLHTQKKTGFSHYTILFRYLKEKSPDKSGDYNGVKLFFRLFSFYIQFLFVSKYTKFIKKRLKID